MMQGFGGQIMPALQSSGRDGGTDGTSRLDNRDLLMYNNSSSLSNFVLPQTTYRTNHTNRSNSYALMGALNGKGRGGTLGDAGGLTTNVNQGHNASNSAIPKLQNIPQSSIRQQHNMSQ